MAIKFEPKPTDDKGEKPKEAARPKPAAKPAGALPPAESELPFGKPKPKRGKPS